MTDQQDHLVAILTKKINSCLRSLGRAENEISSLKHKILELQQRSQISHGSNEDINKYVDLAALAYFELKKRDVFFGRLFGPKIAEKEVYKILNRSHHFQREWYSQRYTDVRRARIDPLRHYLRHGFAEGRWPSPLFDTRYYLRSNDDVLKSGINPLYHFVKHGLQEGRNPNALFDLNFYRRVSLLDKASVDPVVHYYVSSDDQDMETSLSFSDKLFKERNTMFDYSRYKPLVYALHGPDI